VIKRIQIFFLNVTKVSKEFKTRPSEWLRLPSSIKFIKALIKNKIKSNNKNFNKIIKKFIKDEKIGDVGKSHITSDDYFVGIIENLKEKELTKLIKIIGLISIKRGTRQD